jgi:NADPH:quinone reductase-like Zn-dependent oxidoreductase
VVEAVGPGVSNVAAGDRVYIALVGQAMGTYATKALVDAKAVHPLPESVSFAQGAGMSFQEPRHVRAANETPRRQPRTMIVT